MIYLWHLAAYAIAFHILLPNTTPFQGFDISLIKVIDKSINTLECLWAASSIQCPVPTILTFHYILQIFTMLLGEYNYASNFILPVESGFWAKALFVVFVLDMSVVLMNLILGMAVSDIEALQKSSAIKRMVNETMIVDNMETFFCFGGTIMPWMDRYLSKL